jgi:hypothetical protein
MRLDFAVLALSLMTSASAAAINDQNTARADGFAVSDEHDLYKRKGGGGRGGGGSRGGSSGGSRGGSSSGNRGGSSGSRPNSNTGGFSPRGSGPQPRFGGGQYYGGGAKVPFAAGNRARNGAGLAVAGGLLLGASLAFWPGLWLAGAYLYPYDHHYRFDNETSGQEEELPVICGCARYSVCSCDEQDNNTVYLDELVGNGSYDGLNKSIVTVAQRDGEKVLLINGTLPNGTTAEGGEDGAGNSLKSHLEALGYWPVLATVAAIVLTA